MGAFTGRFGGGGSEAGAAVEARIFDGARMLVFLAMVAREGQWALAFVATASDGAHALVLTGSGCAGRDLAVDARVAWQTLAGVFQAVALAKTLVLAGLFHHAWMHIFLTILAGKTWLARAFVIFGALIVTNGAVFTRLFGGTWSHILFAVFPGKSGWTTAFIVGTAHVTAFGAVLTGLFGGARANVGFAIFAFESWFASA